MRAQWAAWAVGLALCLYGLFDGIAMWSFGYSLAMLLMLAVAPLCWNWPSRRRLRPPKAVPPTSRARHARNLLLLAGCSLGMSLAVARQLGDLPPAYHDEFSYLFQAKTYLSGRLWVPSHPTHPELFDQMHVLNDHGKMASRYFPGPGLWLAPFVAWGEPYVGQWVCSLLITWFVYACGWELQGARAGLIAGLLTAFSPGMALFGNLLLAHQPTLLGLSFFLWMIVRLQRTGSGQDALAAGIGLTWAMLCRPMTAAGFGLPFGLWTAAWLLRRSVSARSKFAVVLGFAAPLGVGFALQMGSNVSITGSPWRTPYQMYTDIYTPRHVYGFNNVLRGEQHLGPKVIDGYDRWAVNLTPALAVQNVGIRLANSLLLTWDMLPLALVACLWLIGFPRQEWRQRYLMLAILSLHAVYIPYWYDGIMGWHYVFETLILWTVLAGCVCDALIAAWKETGKTSMPAWLYAFGILTVAANLLGVQPVWTSKLAQSLPSLRYPRIKQQEFQEWVKSAVGPQPALVLVAPHRDQGHLDYVVNDPGWDHPILYGRYQPERTDLKALLRDFGDREMYLCEPDRHRLRRISGSP